MDVKAEAQVCCVAQLCFGVKLKSNASPCCKQSANEYQEGYKQDRLKIVIGMFHIIAGFKETSFDGIRYIGKIEGFGNKGIGTIIT